MPQTVLFPTMSLSPGSFVDATGSTNTQGYNDSRQLVKPKYCYPGGDTTSANRIFLSLYEEEEACEELEWPEDHELNEVNAMEFCTETRGDATYRPTIYFVSRIFDSIKGFHKVAVFESWLLQTYGTKYFLGQGYLDLSGRHPEVSVNLVFLSI